MNLLDILAFGQATWYLVQNGRIKRLKLDPNKSMEKQFPKAKMTATQYLLLGHWSSLRFEARTFNNQYYIDVKINFPQVYKRYDALKVVKFILLIEQLSHTKINWHISFMDIKSELRPLRMVNTKNGIGADNLKTILKV